MLDADITKCFDRINHEALLRKLNTSPTIRRQIRAWLKAGVMDGGQLFPTSVSEAGARTRATGTPQGGVISPLLANIALHGMEERIDKAFPEMSQTMRETWYHKKGTKFVSPRFIRYADDFVILHKDITVVQRCREIISEWLIDMGLELKPSKTRLTHTLNGYGSEKPGFNFLGFNIRQWKVGKARRTEVSVRQTLRKYHSKEGFKTIISPSKEKQKIHYDRIASIIDDHKAAPQMALISRLNPVITGWSNYYSTSVSKVIFADLDNLMYPKLKAWAQHRQQKKSGGWVSKKYWQTIGGDNWVFATRQEGKNPMRLRSHTETKIIRHVKVEGDASPYDGNLIYWSSRCDSL